MSYHQEQQQYPPDQPQQPQHSPGETPYGPPPAVAMSDDRTWAMASHAGSFLAAWLALGILCPILVLLVKNSSAFVRHHAYESLNFQLNALAWIAISVLTMIIGIGFVLLVVVGVWYAIFVIVAAVNANNGEWYRYPLIVRVFNP